MILSIDMGASRTKWALYTGAGGERAAGTVRPLSGHLYTAAAREELAAGLAELRAALPDPPAVVVAGVTGLQAELAPLIEAELGRLFHLPPARVRVTDDLHLAYAAHFAPGEGVLVYAGTGAVAYHRTVTGEVVRAGGYGYLIDDAGGAFWQGRAGLRHALREREEGRPEDRLAAEVFGALGSRDWGTIRALVYGEGRSALARLAPAVYRAACSGDPEAGALQRCAGEELARLARTVLARTEARTLAAAGGAFNPLVLAAFQSALEGEAFTLVPAAAPVTGGLALARDLLPSPTPGARL